MARCQCNLGGRQVKRVFSNSDGRDSVLNPFVARLHRASRIHLAAPYFTWADAVADAAKSGKAIQLLVGLNAATSPNALRAVSNIPGLSVRYLTHRFHAKIYIFDNDALLGSSNLTEAGLMQNREAVICLDGSRDPDAVDEVKAVFQDLWETAAVLTDDTLRAFRTAWEATRGTPDRDSLIEDAVGRTEPLNVNVSSHKKSNVRAFLDPLQREVYEQFRPAFNEVTRLLTENGFRRPELAGVGVANETNRFLNWVRLTYVHGDEAWSTAPLRSEPERRKEILALGAEWTVAKNHRVPEIYEEWLSNVQAIFGSEDHLRQASRDSLTTGLMSLHAFTEQSRFVSGGMTNLAESFWTANGNDAAKVRRSLAHLVHGGGDFVERLHDVLYDPSMKLKEFGRFSALELYGTVKPEECPPMNGRMAKALRYLGFDVHAT
jgi:hypothetical protein